MRKAHGQNSTDRGYPLGRLVSLRLRQEPGSRKPTIRVCGCRLDLRPDGAVPSHLATTRQLACGIVKMSGGWRSCLPLAQRLAQKSDGGCLAY